MQKGNDTGATLRRLRLSRTGSGRDGRMTQAELGRLSGVGSKETISKMERGAVRIRSDDLQRLARALGVPLSAFFEPAPSPRVLQEEAVPYTPPASSFNAHIPLSETQSWFSVTDSHLDQLGIVPGAEVIIDRAPAALNELAIGDVVLASLTLADGAGTKHILRQWLPPHLLVTNSLRHNELPLNIAIDPVVIVGVLVYPRPRFQQRGTPR